MKKQTGITLIALVITIIVLLILAVVAIGAVKNSGIIIHAQNASNIHETEKLKEEIELALADWTIQKYYPGNNPGTFKAFMQARLGDKVEITENDEGL